MTRCIAGFVLIAALAIAAPLHAEEPPKGEPAAKPDKPRLPVTIGKDTTRITEPLDKDGYPDYLAWLNRKLSQGVTPENNFAVPFWQAMGPAAIDEAIRERYFKMLGMAMPPEKGDYYVTFEEVAKRLKEDGPTELTPEAEEQEEEETDELLWKEQDRAYEGPWTPKDCPRAAAWVAANERPLMLIVEASRRPRRYTPLIAEEDPRILLAAILPEIQQDREAARVLLARAMLRLGEGKVDEACEDLLTIHRLARQVGQGATLIDALVAIAIDGMACNGDKALFASGRLTAAQARRMQADLEKLPPIAAMDAAMDVAERFMFLDAVIYIARHGLSKLSQIAGSEVSDGTLSGLTDVAARLTIDWDSILRKGNQWYDRLVSDARKPTRAERKAALDQMDKDVKSALDKAKDPARMALAMLGNPRRTVSDRIGDVFVALFLPATGAALGAEDRGRMNFEITKLGFALAAYRAEQGKYPARLEDLVPKYLPQVPDDVFSGGPLVYRLQPGGYLLYSVGMNETDDGGRSYDEANDEAAPPGADWDDLVIRLPSK